MVEKSPVSFGIVSFKFLVALPAQSKATVFEDFTWHGNHLATHRQGYKLANFPC